MFRRVVAASLLAALVVAGPVAAATTPSSSQTLGSIARTVAAAPEAKVVIVVGPTHDVTSKYRTYADAIAAEAIKYTSNVVKVYSPNATWANVRAALQGANVVVYLGHGNGWPSPYTFDPAYATKDGMGLNYDTNGDGKLSDYELKYYGEPYFANEVRFAPNAIVLLNHLCYSAGNSEPGDPDPTLDVAKQRVDNYGAGFIKAGAQAVLAEAHGSVTGVMRDLFTTDQTVDQMWRTQWDYNGNEFSFPSVRSAGYTDYMDPDSPSGGYFRSLVTLPGLTTTQVRGSGPTWDGSGTRYVPVAPARVLDTRFGVGLSGMFTTATPRVFQVAGKAGIPLDAVAVTGNVTVVGQTSAGWLAVTPVATSLPSTSTLNFPVRDNRANGLTIRLGTAGTLSAVFRGTSGAKTNLIFDVTGYFTTGAGSTYVPVDPARVLDTRFGNGLDGPFTSGVPRSVAIAGRGGVPNDAVAITGNITVTRQTTAGWIAVTPEATASPSTSTLNFPGGDNRANNFTVPLAGDGSIGIVFRGGANATAHVIVDVTGYFVPNDSGALYFPVSPTRVLDTRFGVGLSGPFDAAAPRSFQVVDGSAIPSSAVAITGNTTEVSASNAGWVTLMPEATADPSTSTLNFPASDTRANGVGLPLAAGKLAAVYLPALGATTHLILDVTGYFEPAP